MTKNLPSSVPKPRAAIADKALSRPDWTVSDRNTNGVLALDKNETTDKAFHQVIAEVLKALPVDSIVEYPECAPYYRLLADHLDIRPHNLLFTAGADGAIRMVFEAFLSPGEKVLLTSPTFAMFSIYACMYGGHVIYLPYEASETGPLLTADTICQSLVVHRPRLFCLSNPDSPTGTIFQAGELTRIIQTAADIGAVILVDEAYYPFSNVTALNLIHTFPNLVISRTFAKAWGLAGLRLGYAAANSEMANILHKVRPMYEVNGLALAAMAKMIIRKGDMEMSVRRIHDGKAYFLERMRGNGFRVLEGAGNFLHVDFGETRNAIHAALKGKVLYKTSFPDACLEGFSRFSAAPKPVMAELANLVDGALR